MTRRRLLLILHISILVVVPFWTFVWQINIVHAEAPNKFEDITNSTEWTANTPGKAAIKYLDNNPFAPDGQNILETETSPQTCTIPVTIMPLGDSITKGTGTCSAPDTYLNCIGYRHGLWDSLVNAGYSVNFVGSQGGQFQYLYNDPYHDNDHEGHGAYKANDIIDNIYGSGSNWLQNYPADVILLHIGTNDITAGQDPAGIATEIGQILDKVDQYENDHSTQVTVVLARIINRSDPTSPLGIKTTSLNNAIQNLANARITAGDKIIVANMEPVLAYPADLGDEVHPNSTGYQKMVGVWKTALDVVLACAVDDSSAVNEDSGATSLSVLDNDQGSTQTITVVGSGSAGGTISTDGSVVTYTPDPNYFGDETFTYTLNYGLPPAGHSTAIVTVTVQAVNDPPTFDKGSDQVVDEDSGAKTITGWATNISPGPGEDGQSLTFQVSNDNNMLFSQQPAVDANGNLSFTPALNANGASTITVILTDDGGTLNGGEDTSAPQTFSITINPVNDDPIANDDSFTVLEDSGETSLNVMENDSTPDNGENLVISGIGTGTTSGSVRIAQDGQTILYTPKNNFMGLDHFTYTIADGTGRYDSAEVTVVVDPVNDPPKVTNPGDQVNKDGDNVALQIIATDPEGSPLKYKAVHLPAGLGIGENSGLISGKLLTGSVGKYTVQVTVSDGSMAQDVTLDFKWDVSAAIYIPVIIGGH